MSQESTDSDTLRLALPKGRMQDAILALLADAGIRVTPTARGYRPAVSLSDCEAKILKHQNIVEMLELGSRDVGFAGADWVQELDADIVELLDTELDPVSVVAAAPTGLFDRLDEIGRPLVVASEYERLTKAWIARRSLDAEFVRSFGATEVFPPEDADVIVDNTATGSTLRANDLEIVDTVITSSTRLYASPQAMETDGKRERIEDLSLLLRSVLDENHANRMTTVTSRAGPTIAKISASASAPAIWAAHKIPRIQIAHPRGRRAASSSASSQRLRVRSSCVWRRSRSNFTT